MTGILETLHPNILKNVGNQILTSIVFSPIISTVWLSIFFKESFVFSRKNKFIQVWNNLKVQCVMFRGIC